MAVTKIRSIKGSPSRTLTYAANKDKTAVLQKITQFQAMEDVIEYVEKSEKTHSTHYVTGINCVSEYAHEDFVRTKQMWDKNGGIQCYHAMQSFNPGEADPDTVHEIGIKLAQIMWGDRFEVLVTTHLDKEHLHNHFVINSVSFLDGGKYHRSIGEKERLRNVSDALCAEYRLSIVGQDGKATVPNKLKEIGLKPPPKKRKNVSYRANIRKDLNSLVRDVNALDELYIRLQGMGYRVKADVEHVAIKAPGMQRFVRLRSLGDAYTPSALSMRIAKNNEVTIYRTNKKISRIKHRRRTSRPWFVRQFRYYYVRLNKLTAWRDDLIRRYGKASVDFEAVRMVEDYSSTIRVLCKYQFKSIEQVNDFIKGHFGTENERRLLRLVIQKQQRREVQGHEQRH